MFAFTYKFTVFISLLSYLCNILTFYPPYLVILLLNPNLSWCNYLISITQKKIKNLSRFDSEIRFIVDFVV